MKDGSKLILILLSLFLLISLTGKVYADNLIKVAAINAEWLWTPFDKKVDGGKVNQGDMSIAAYRREIRFYASLAKKEKLDLIAFAEIENNWVLEDISRLLGKGWQSYFVQGRDTATGQDVGIITRLDVKPGSVSHLGFPCGQVLKLKKRKCLSKVLGLTLTIEGNHIHMLTSHFLSRRNNSKKKELKRQSQALALVNGMQQINPFREDPLIALGDFNDRFGSPTINLLMSKSGLKNTIDCGGPKKKDGRIDHILYTGLSCLRDYRVDLSEFSDHDAVIAQFRLR